MAQHEYGEFEDEEETYNARLAEILAMMDAAKGKITVFTGAGISTAAKIPDYNGSNGLKRRPVPMVVLGLQEADLTYVMPTYAHAAIAALIEAGIVENIVTSNHDGLHQKSQVDDALIADIFGNVYKELCLKCSTLYTRKVFVPASVLGRRCDNAECGGRLKKYGTRMEGMCNQECYEKSWAFGHGCDMALVLGSSMGISTYADLALACGNTAICNLQPTHADDAATVKVHTTCDRLMRDVVAHFGVAVGDLAVPFEWKVEWERPAAADPTTVRLVSDRRNEAPCFAEEATVSVVAVGEDGSAAAGSSSSSAAAAAATVVEMERARDCTFEAQVDVDAGSGAALSLVVRFNDQLGIEAACVEVPVPAGATHGELVCSVVKRVSFDA